MQIKKGEKLIPQLFFVPSSEATIEDTLLRMHELAEEYDMTVFLVSKIDENDYRLSKQYVKPKPKSLFLKKGGVRVPKYMNVYMDKDSRGNMSPSISIKGHFFSLPHRLFGKKFYFGTLVDESIKLEPQTPS